MEISAASLLTIFLAATTVTDGVPTSTVSISPTITEFVRNEANAITTESVKSTTQSKFIDYARPFSNIKNILMQEIRTLDKDVSDVKIQEEVAETLKAEAQRDHTDLRIKTTAKPSNLTTKKVKLATENKEFKKFDNAIYDEELNENDEEDYYDEDGDTELDDDDEEVMTQCPDYCKCAGQYAAAMTATYVS